MDGGPFVNQSIGKASFFELRGRNRMTNKTKIAKRRHTRIEKIQTIGREPLSGTG